VPLPIFLKRGGQEEARRVRPGFGTYWVLGTWDLGLGLVLVLALGDFPPQQAKPGALGSNRLG